MIAVCLFVLFLIVPFEPRFTVPVGPLHLSLVEAVALPCFGILAAMTRKDARREPLRLSRPLIALGGFVVVAVVSAALARVEPLRAFKFALRLGAMLTCAVLVARVDDRARSWAFRGLLASGSVAAVLAIVEGIGVRSIDVLLGAFREIPFNVAGVRRASAGSEYPNLGAAMILYALLCGVVLLRGRPWLRAGFVVAMTFGLAQTYSRGGWLAGLVALGVGAIFERGRGRLAPVLAYAGVLAVFVFGQEISQIRFGGENANDFYAATYKSPKQFAMDASARVIVPVEVRNVGRRPWRIADQIHLSYHLYENSTRPLVDGPRTDLPHDVLPGESVTLDAILRAPRRPGEYVLMWDLVHEDTTWFSGQGVAPGVARLLVGGAEEAAPVDAPASAPARPADKGMGLAVPAAVEPILAPEALAWRPSRADLWRLAARMWAANPFFGIGPDNYRWTYGTLAGKKTFDTRVFANNMYLEFAATLGTFGLATFLAALCFALLRGVSAAPTSDTARIAVAILVAMSVHGFADYVLAFTGHYLVFALAIATLSAPEAVIRRAP